MVDIVDWTTSSSLTDGVIVLVTATEFLLPFQFVPITFGVVGGVTGRRGTGLFSHGGGGVGVVVVAVVWKDVVVAAIVIVMLVGGR